MEQFIKGDVVVIPFPLPISSFIRPDRIFTAYKGNIITKAGSLTDIKMQSVIEAVHQIIK